MCDKIEQVLEALGELQSAMSKLEDLGVVRTKRTTGEVAEWIVRELLGGELPADPNNAGWDVNVGEVRYQVKGHAKASGNPARWSALSREPSRDDFDFLVIVELTPQFRIRAIRRGHVDQIRARKCGNCFRVNWDDVPELSREELQECVGWQTIMPLFAG